LPTALALKRELLLDLKPGNVNYDFVLLTLLALIPAGEYVAIAAAAQLLNNI